jgi:hypothetical protein
VAIAEPSRGQSVGLPVAVVKDSARLLAARRPSRTGTPQRIDTGFDHNRVTIFLLDSLFQTGYGYSREQAKGSLLDKAMQMPAQAES